MNSNDKYPDSSGISVSYAQGLSAITDAADKEACNREMETIKALMDQFPDEEMFVIIYLTSLAELTGDDFYSDLHPVLDEAEAGLNRFPEDENTVAAYARVLAEAGFRLQKEDQLILVRLEKVCRKFPDNQDIAGYFADVFESAMNHLSPEQLKKPSKFLSLLYRRFPRSKSIEEAVDERLLQINSDLSLLFTVVSRKNPRTDILDLSKIREHIAQAEKKLEEDPENLESVTSLADWYSVLVSRQTDEKLLKTINRLQELHQQYPDEIMTSRVLANALADLISLRSPEESAPDLQALASLNLSHPGDTELTRAWIAALFSLFHKTDNEEQRRALLNSIESAAESRKELPFFGAVLASVYRLESELQTPEEQNETLNKLRSLASLHPSVWDIQKALGEVLSREALKEMMAFSGKKTDQISALDEILSGSYLLGDVFRGKAEKLIQQADQPERQKILDCLMALSKKYKDNEAGITVLAMMLTPFELNSSQKVKMKVMKQIGSMYRKYDQNILLAFFYSQAVAAAGAYQSANELRNSYKKFWMQHRSLELKISICLLPVSTKLRNIFWRKIRETEMESCQK